MEDTSELFPCLPLLPEVSPDLALQCKRSLPSLRRARPPVLWTRECFSDTRRGARTGWVFCARVARQLLSAPCCRHTSGPTPSMCRPALRGKHRNSTQRYTHNRPGHQTGRGERRTRCLCGASDRPRPPCRRAGAAPDSPVGACTRRPRKYRL